MNPKYADLHQYCTSDVQKNQYGTFVKIGKMRSAAQELGITYQTIQTLLRTLLARKKRGGIYNPATREVKPIATTAELDTTSKMASMQGRSRYVITSAQNATPANANALASLHVYCKHNDAELVVIPIRYHNPTSRWTENDEDKNWWSPELAPYLLNRRVELCENLVLLADIRIQPTAVRPTSGMETFCGGQSTIIGHPKLETVTIPTPQNALAKIITTTGAITMDNYTDSKAGKKGEHHHAFGAVVVDLAKDGSTFFMRQINIDDDTGEFYDLDGLYAPSGYTGGHRAEGLVLGDLHERFVDPGVVAATFTAKDSMMAVLRPVAMVYHDVMDFHSQNHHHKHKVFTRIAKHTGRRSSVEDEVSECAAFVAYHSEAERVIFAPSNHPDALARWVEDTDWKDDPENCIFYLKTALLMAESAKMGETGAMCIDPFTHWMREKLPATVRERCEFPARDESVRIAGIECGMHGDKGPNGSRGAIRGFGRIGVKSIIGHSHTPGVMDGVYQVGTSSRLRLEYNSGPSSWMHCHCVIYPNGKRTLLWIIDGKWRLTAQRARRRNAA